MSLNLKINLGQVTPFQSMYYFLWHSIHYINASCYKIHCELITKHVVIIVFLCTVNVSKVPCTFLSCINLLHCFVCLRGSVWGLLFFT